MPLVKSPDSDTLRVYVRPMQDAWSMKRSEIANHPFTLHTHELPLTIWGGLHLHPSTDGVREHAILSALAPKALGAMNSDQMQALYERHFGIRFTADGTFNMATLTLTGVGRPLRLLTASGLFDAPVMAGLPDSVKPIIGGLLAVPEKYWASIPKRGLIVSDRYAGTSEESIAIPTLELAKRRIAPSITGWWKELLGFTPRSLVTVGVNHVGDERMTSILRNFRPIGVLVT